MKPLSKDEAGHLLSEIGMTLNDWNQIKYCDDSVCCKPNWLNYHPPKDKLLGFSHHAAAWLPQGKWKIFQIDNSTGWMDPVQASLFAGLLFGGENIESLDRIENMTFLFEFNGDKEENANKELLISNLIYVFLLFESHGYVVSSNSKEGQLLGIQDGFVYFSSLDRNIFGAKALLANFEGNPLMLPQWLMDVFVRRQENSIQLSQRGGSSKL